MRGLAAAVALNAGPHRRAELEEQNLGATEALEDAKSTLVALQNHDAELVRDWQKLIDCTMRAVYESFDLLDVTLGPEHNRGESTYRERLSEVIASFEAAKLAHEDAGALVVRLPGRERPVLIRKSDGGYLYATTDLAAVRHRVQTLGANRVIYVVDARQRDHFADVFAAAHLIGWDRMTDGAEAELIHVPFGSVLGPDKTPLKTRSGDNVTLRTLLDEAIERGSAEVTQRAQDERAPTHGLSGTELRAIGKAVGIGAVKYADLSNDLVRDYVFDFDRMIAFEGNTGPYLQYAHARACKVLRESGDDTAVYAGAAFTLRTAEEKRMALLMLR
jgi:arginyl-tRNA synthetase